MRLKPSLVPACAVAAIGAVLASPAVVASAAPRVAQTVPPMPARAASLAAAPAHGSSVTFHARNGTIVTIKSRPAPGKSASPAPSFASLDTDHNGSISASEANDYPPLANAFLYVDSSHNGAISKAEYTHWINQP